MGGGEETVAQSFINSETKNGRCSGRLDFSVRVARLERGAAWRLGSMQSGVWRFSRGRRGLGGGRARWAPVERAGWALAQGSASGRRRGGVQGAAG